MNLYIIICKIIYICVNGNKEHEAVHKSSWNKKRKLFPFRINRTQMQISNRTTCNNTDMSVSVKNTKGKKEKDNKYSPLI